MTANDPAPVLSGEAPGELGLAGSLRFADVTGLLETLPVGAGAYQVDLSGLGAVDSAGVALILEWRLRLEAAGGTLTITNPPQRLVRLAGIGGVAKLLGLKTNEWGTADA
ncbi:MAG: STAS domain-containing protein [Spiribacter salinus]|uniref:STAS domain-containing protein n=1 Tax=Spiribacter salinus TaxID=1335746 RepID=A0A540VR20_9GAMM|nr:STAS domain-containing protein [Spiribacter sp.]TQE99215.1 MAG: STAS domain-containing protein [Spiribacter salinus]